MGPRASGLILFKDKKNYTDILSILEDLENMPKTYEDWQLDAEQNLNKMEFEGIIPVPTEVTPEDFSFWFISRGLPVNTHSLKEYADFKAIRFPRKMNL